MFAYNTDKTIMIELKSQSMNGLEFFTVTINGTVLTTRPHRNYAMDKAIAFRDKLKSLGAKACILDYTIALKGA